MKRTIATSVAAIVLVALGFAAVAEVARHPSAPSPRLGMEVDVEPVQGKAGEFLLTSTVTDLESNAVIAQPRMRIAGGQPARLSAAGKDGWSFHITVSADGSARKADYEAVFSREGRVVARQRLSVNLNG